METGSHEKPRALDPSTFRSTLGRFVTGVTVMTARLPQGQQAGVTVSSFNTLSLDPPLILWSIALTAPSLAVFREAQHFAVNILAHDQQDVALQFARAAPDKFAGIETVEGSFGAPLITGAVAHLECKVADRHPGGDHEIFVGRLLQASAADRDPLAYHQGSFGHFRPAAAANRSATRSQD